MAKTGPNKTKDWRSGKYGHRAGRKMKLFNASSEIHMNKIPSPLFYDMMVKIGLIVPPPMVDPNSTVVEANDPATENFVGGLPSGLDPQSETIFTTN